MKKTIYQINWWRELKAVFKTCEECFNYCHQKRKCIIFNRVQPGLWEERNTEHNLRLLTFDLLKRSKVPDLGQTHPKHFHSCQNFSYISLLTYEHSRADWSTLMHLSNFKISCTGDHDACPSHHFRQLWWHWEHSTCPFIMTKQKLSFMPQQRKLTSYSVWAFNPRWGMVLQKLRKCHPVNEHLNFPLACRMNQLLQFQQGAFPNYALVLLLNRRRRKGATAGSYWYLILHLFLLYCFL